MGIPGSIIQLMEGNLAVCRLDPGVTIPGWALAKGPLCSITRTADELSVVCLENAVPVGTRCERGWRALKVQGPLDFGLTGVLDALTGPLAKAGISIFALSTFDTDYLLLRQASLDEALAVLRAAGHTLRP